MVGVRGKESGTQREGGRKRRGIRRGRGGKESETEREGREEERGIVLLSIATLDAEEQRCYILPQDGFVFKHIAGVHSELYAVDSEGKLHGWVWSSSTPRLRPHPLEEHLDLQDEKIKLIGGKFLRASIVTESGKVGVVNGMQLLVI
jgi:hypothetical protein